VRSTSRGSNQHVAMTASGPPTVHPDNPKHWSSNLAGDRLKGGGDTLASAADE
jgi:hypothetical protein